MQCMMEFLCNLNSLFCYQIAIPCLDLILNRRLIMDTIFLLYESIITEVIRTLFMCHSIVPHCTNLALDCRGGHLHHFSCSCTYNMLADHIADWNGIYILWQTITIISLYKISIVFHINSCPTVYGDWLG